MAFIGGLIQSGFDVKIAVGVIAYGRPLEKFVLLGGAQDRQAPREEGASPQGVSGQVKRIVFNFSNLTEDKDIIVRLEDSDHANGPSDNNKGDSYPFDVSFAAISGKEVTIKPLGNVSVTVDVTTKAFLAINAKASAAGGASLRAQVQAVGLQIDRI